MVNRRALAMLRAVGAGRAELTCSCEPDLRVDGLPCCDQATAHDLARAGLIRPARVVAALLGLGVTTLVVPALLLGVPLVVGTTLLRLAVLVVATLLLAVTLV